MVMECRIKTMTKIMSGTITLREMSHGWCNGKQMYDATAWRWNVVLRQCIKQCLVLSDLVRCQMDNVIETKCMMLQHGDRMSF